MKKETVLGLLPATVMVTDDILSLSNPMNTRYCIGANSLKTLLGVPLDNEHTVTWGREDGYVINEDEQVIRVMALNKEGTARVDMMAIEEPVEVQFVPYEDRFWDLPMLEGDVLVSTKMAFL